jgi:hypothetical protein
VAWQQTTCNNNNTVLSNCSNYMLLKWPWVGTWKFKISPSKLSVTSRSTHSSSRYVWLLYSSILNYTVL